MSFDLRPFRFYTNEVLLSPRRLDLRKRELMLQKEELLKESKVKQTTVDNVKAQFDLFMKVSIILLCFVFAHSPSYSMRRRLKKM